MQTTVQHDTQLVCYPFWHIKPMEFIVQKGRETTVILLRVTNHAGISVEHLLQLIGDCLWRPCIDCNAVVDAWVVVVAAAAAAAVVVCMCTQVTWIHRCCNASSAVMRLCTSTTSILLRRSLALSDTAFHTSLDVYTTHKKDRECIPYFI